MIRRPPRSTLFPTRRSSDLEHPRRPARNNGQRKENGMAKFMDVHSGFVGVTASQLREAHDRDLAIERDEGVHFERSEEHTSELQSRQYLVCRLLLEKKYVKR